MNDTTSLSSTYSAASAFAKAFNAAVLVLKRRHLVGGELPAPAPAEEGEARRTLAESVRGVISQLSPEAADVAHAGERIPSAIITRLVEKHRDKLGWLVSDLRQAGQALGEAAPLGRDDFAALDEVCDAADATASASFRRLWRR
jgi:hypothetical protein